MNNIPNPNYDYEEDHDYEEDYYEEDDINDWYEDEQERIFEEECEKAATCKCGAWQFNKNGKPVHVADCFCGAE